MTSPLGGRQTKKFHYLKNETKKTLTVSHALDEVLESFYQFSRLQREEEEEAEEVVVIDYITASQSAGVAELQVLHRAKD